MRRVANGVGVVVAIGAAAIGAAALALAAVSLALQTDAGRGMVATMVSDLVSTPEFGLEFESVDELSPDRIRLGKVRVRDAHSRWLEITSVDIAWRPVSLFGGRLTIDTVTIGRVEVTRVPEKSKAEKSNGLLLPVTLDLRRFAIDRIVLDPSLASVAATVTASGSAALDIDGTGEFRLDARRIDGDGGTLAVRTAFDLVNDALDISLSLHEPSGGLLARRLDLPGLPPTSIDLAGKGTLGSWRGSLVATAGSAASLSADVALRYDGSRLAVDLSGKADTVRVLPDAAAKLIGADATFDLHLAWRPAEDAIEVASSRIVVAALEADFGGRIDLRTMDATVNGRLGTRDANAVSALLAPVTLRDAKANFAWRERTLIADVAISGFATGEPAIDFVLGPAPRAHFNVRPDSRGWFDVIDARLDLAAGSLTGSGSLDPRTGQGDMALTSPTIDLGVVGASLGLPVTGRGSATILVRGDRDNLSGALSVAIDEWASQAVPATWARFARTAALGLDFEGGEGRPWGLSDITLDSGTFRAEGSAVLSADLGALDARYRVAAPDLSPLSNVVGVALSGSAHANGTATGPWGRFAGRTEITASTPWGVADAGAGWRFVGPMRLDLRDLSVTTLGIRASGDLAVNLDGGGVDGTLKVATRDVAAIAAAAGIDAGGPAAANLHLFTDATRQGVAFGIGADELRLGSAASIVIRRAEATGTLRDAFGASRFDVRLDAENLSTGGFEAERAAVSAVGSATNLRFEASVAGAPEWPFDATAKGMAERHGDGVRLRIEQAEGHAFGTGIRLAAPVEADIGGPALAVRGLDLSVMNGRIRGDFRLTESEVTLRGDASALPLALVRNWMPGETPSGRVDGEIRISGPPGAPDGSFRIAMQNAEIGVVDRRIGLRGNLEGRFDGGLLRWSGEANLADAGSIKVAGRLPLRFAVRPFVFGPAAGANLFLEANGHGDIGAAWASLGVDPHRLDGKVAFDVKVSGGAGRRSATGTVRVDGGRYENFDTATVIDNIAVEARLDDGVLRILHGSGKAGNGTVTLAGKLGGLLDARPTLDLHLTADKAELIARDDVTASASADIRVSGGIEGIGVAGHVIAEQAEIRLVGMEGDSVTPLDVVEINGKGGTVAATPPPAASAEETIGVDLNLELDVPRRFFVRGRGLDSEWSGRFTLGGTFAEPRLTGKLTPVRGQYSFSGKAFVFKEGMIELHGDAAMVPAIDLAAEHRTRDLTARIRVRGSADRPEIELSSVPSMPQDEILSRVLFGRGVSRISAVEAAQIADALATLSGHGGGGVLDAARRMLGVDVLRVEGGDSGEAPGVTAGRYVGKGVFVGVTQGADPKGGEARVEVEVTPNVSVETDIGPNTSGRVGARWSLDY